MPKTPSRKDFISAADTEATVAEDQTDDNAPTPKQWSSDWDPTLNSLLSVYVLCQLLYYYTLIQPFSCIVHIVHIVYLCFNSLLYFMYICSVV